MCQFMDAAFEVKRRWLVNRITDRYHVIGPGSAIPLPRQIRLRINVPMTLR